MAREAVEVRITGSSEAVVRAAADKVGVTLTQVKARKDCSQGYGHIVIEVDDKGRPIE